MTSLTLLRVLFIITWWDWDYVQYIPLPFIEGKYSLNLVFSSGDDNFSLNVLYSDSTKKHDMKIKVRDNKQESGFIDLGTFPIDRNEEIGHIISDTLEKYKVDKSSVEEKTTNKKKTEVDESSIKKDLASLHEKVDRILELIQEMTKNNSISPI